MNEVTDMPTYTRREGIRERQLAQELILYDPGTDRVFLLNSTSVAIWALCAGVLSPEHIAGRLAERFRAPHKRVLEDVKRTITWLANEGLLVVQAK